MYEREAEEALLMRRLLCELVQREVREVWFLQGEFATDGLKCLVLPGRRSVGTAEGLGVDEIPGTICPRTVGGARKGLRVSKWLLKEYPD